MKTLTLSILFALSAAAAPIQPPGIRVNNIYISPQTMSKAASLCENSGRTNIVTIGPGFYAFGGFDFNYNTTLIGSGTNKTFLVGDSVDFQAHVVANVTFQSLTMISNQISYDAAIDHCTNNVLMDVLLICTANTPGRSPVYVSLQPTSFGTVNTLVISNSVISGVPMGIETLADDTVFGGNFMLLKTYNSEILGTGVNTTATKDVNAVFLMGTNSWLSAFNTMFKASGGSNSVCGVLAFSGAGVYFDNCRWQFGTNLLKRDPATAAMSVWVTNGVATRFSKAWFRNISGQVTNNTLAANPAGGAHGTFANNGVVYVNDPVLFPTPWPEQR